MSNPRGWAAGPGRRRRRTRGCATSRRSGLHPRDVHDQPGLRQPGGGREVGRRGRARAAPRRGDRGAGRGGAHRLGGRLGRRRRRGGPPGMQALRQTRRDRRSRCSTSSATTTPTCCSSRWPGRGRCSARGPATWPTYLAAVEHHPKAGVCLDTCHLFAAGHDLTARRRGAPRCSAQLRRRPAGPRPGQAGARQRLAARLRVQARPARGDRRGQDRHRAVPRAARGPARCPVRGGDARREGGARAGHRYAEGTSRAAADGAAHARHAVRRRGWVRWLW